MSLTDHLQCGPFLCQIVPHLTSLDSLQHMYVALSPLQKHFMRIQGVTKRKSRFSSTESLEVSVGVEGQDLFNVMGGSSQVYPLSK